MGAVFIQIITLNNLSSPREPFENNFMAIPKQMFELGAGCHCLAMLMYKISHFSCLSVPAAGCVSSFALNRTSDDIMKGKTAGVDLPLVHLQGPASAWLDSLAVSAYTVHKR